MRPIPPTLATAARPWRNTPSMICVPALATRSWSAAWASSPPTNKLAAGARVLNIQRRELSVDDEIVVIERERSRNAIGIELEADGISRCLLCIVFVRLTALEITHGDRPARHRSQLWLGGSRVVVIAFVGFDLVADHSERIEDFVSGF